MEHIDRLESSPLLESVRLYIAEALNQAIDDALEARSVLQYQPSVQQLFEAIQQECTAVLVTRAREFNRELPNLPVELWHNIWAFVDSETLPMVAEVCHNWRTHLLANIDLWTACHFDADWDVGLRACKCWKCEGREPVFKGGNFTLECEQRTKRRLAMLALFVHRSGDGPFALRVTVPHKVPSSHALLGLGRSLRTFAVRLHTLAVDCVAGDNDTLVFLRHLRLPALQIFRLTCHGGPDNKWVQENSFAPANFVGGNASSSSLQVLLLETGGRIWWPPSIRRGWDKSVFAQVRTLKFSLHSLSELPYLLSLEQLTIDLMHCCTAQSNDRSVLNTFTTFWGKVLPRLRFLDITLDSSAVEAALMPALESNAANSLDVITVRLANDLCDHEQYANAAICVIDAVRDSDVPFRAEVHDVQDLLTRNVGPGVMVVKARGADSAGRQRLRSVWVDYDAISEHAQNLLLTV